MSAPPSPGGVVINDKVVHALVYSVLAWLIFRAFYRITRPGPAALASFGLSAAYGVTDEIHQHFVPGRIPSIHDWFADLTGAGLVCLLAWLVGSAMQKARLADKSIAT